MTVVSLPAVGGAARRWIAGTALALSLAALSLLASLALGLLLGYRPLVVYSGSMSPALETGDVLITRLVRPSAIRPADVVTFRDPSRAGELVTHRVVEVRREGDHFSFLTRGDANTGEERWSVDARGTVGAMSFRVPRAGYPLAWLRRPPVRASLFGAAALILAVLALRRIWGREGPPPGVEAPRTLGSAQALAWRSSDP